jgi:hypothetical protein
MRVLHPRKKKNNNKERKCKLIFQLETPRGKELVLKKARANNEGGEKDSIFSHSHFRQILEGHLWSNLDEISVYCS